MLTSAGQEELFEEFKRMEHWGMIVTDAFGMVSNFHFNHLVLKQGMDVTNIDIIVQYHTTCNLCMLWQRFGRGARRRDRTADAIFLVDKSLTQAA